MLLECIRKKCDITENERIIDVSDVNGNLINLREEKFQTKYATEILKPRQVLVLIEVKNNPDKTPVNFIPLLDNKDIVNENFMLKLLPKVSLAKKTITVKNTPTNSKSQNGPTITAGRRKSITDKSFFDKKKS